jgi:hypothetical protein
LFGSFRKKVTQQTIEMVRQPYAIFQHIYGVPAGFWQDEFVLGFFGVMIGLVSQTLSQDRLSQTDKGYLLQDTFGALSNMNGAAITRRFTELAFQQPQDTAFELGGDNGQIVTLAMFGKGTPKGREAIEEAKKAAAAQGSPGDVAAVAAILARKLFVGPLIERFDLRR